MSPNERREKKSASEDGLGGRPGPSASQHQSPGSYSIRYAVNPRTGKDFYSESSSGMGTNVRNRLDKAIDSLGRGNFGNCFAIKNNFGKCDRMFELKVGFQSGFRIYFRRDDASREIVIATAGKKKSQHRDVVAARNILSGADDGKQFLRWQSTNNLNQKD